VLLALAVFLFTIFVHVYSIYNTYVNRICIFLSVSLSCNLKTVF